MVYTSACKLLRPRLKMLVTACFNNPLICINKSSGNSLGATAEANPVFLISTLWGSVNQRHGTRMALQDWLLSKRQPMAYQERCIWVFQLPELHLLTNIFKCAQQKHIWTGEFFTNDLELESLSNVEPEKKPKPLRIDFMHHWFRPSNKSWLIKT